MKKIILEFIYYTLFVVIFFSCKQKNKIEYREIALNDPKMESVKRGKKIYENNCLQCHLPDGKGTPNDIPPLAGSNWLVEKKIASIHAIKFGLKGKIVVNGENYKGFMPKQSLKPNEVADVMNYILNSWGNYSEKLVTVEEVEIVKK